MMTPAQDKVAPSSTATLVAAGQPKAKLVPVLKGSSDDYPELEGTNGVDHNGIAVGRWKQDLCGCFNSCFPNTLTVFLCPCVSVAQIAHRMGLATYTRALLSFGVVYAISTLCYLVGTVGGRIVAIILGLAMWLCIYRLRVAIRTAFQIPGSMLDDLCSTFWCNCCALSQMATHVESYDPSRCSIGPKTVLPGYNV
ncbi:hypothetical protein AeNC1_001035 [Aphanomyces euteiches]|nr:hypothetical protein AeNC1_001035 [Aphanomyces euteiches]